MVMTEDPRWGILSVFSKPMPLMHSAQVFPRFFISNALLQLVTLFTMGWGNSACAGTNAASVEGIAVLSNDSKYFSE